MAKILISTFKQIVKDTIDKESEKRGGKFSAYYHTKIHGFNIYQGRTKLGVIQYINGKISTTSNSVKQNCTTILEAVDKVLVNAKPSTFQFFQPNPTEGNKCTKGDCAIRAVCCALNIDWREAFDKLCEWAREKYTLPNSLDDTLKPWLESKGFEFIGTGRERPTAKDFAKEHVFGTYILYVQSGYGTHCLTLKEGYLYDAWDSTDCHMYGYFKLA